MIPVPLHVMHVAPFLCLPVRPQIAQGSLMNPTPLHLIQTAAGILGEMFGVSKSSSWGR